MGGSRLYYSPHNVPPLRLLLSRYSLTNLEPRRGDLTHSRLVERHYKDCHVNQGDAIEVL
jgi:hypothetical protein